MLPLQISTCPIVARSVGSSGGSRLACVLWFTGVVFVLAIPEVTCGQTATSAQIIPAAQPSPAAAQIQEPDKELPELTPLLQQLMAPEFSQRQQAVAQLQRFTGSVNGLQQLGAALAANPAPEVARRIMEILEHHFSVTDFNSAEICATSDILEQAALAERWDIAETSRQVLDRLWTTRVNVAVAELVRMKAPLQPKDPQLLWREFGSDNTPAFALNPNSNSILRIFIDEYWPQSPRAFELLQRLSGMSRIGRVSIYSIQGNSLTAEQKSMLKSLFGDTRVQERGRVCLGIIQEPFFGEDSGVLIGNVEKNSSAANAGLESGDVITKMNDEPLQDFDDLVTRLKQYQVGQQIRLEVIRVQQPRFRGLQIPNAPPEQPPAVPARREVAVTLQGWYTREAPEN